MTTHEFTTKQNKLIDPSTGEITPDAPYQLLPLMNDDRYQELKADIAARGVRVPVVYDDQGNILDGHHRVRAWEELTAAGMSMPDYPREIVKFNDEDKKRNHVYALNLLRREMTREERDQVIARMRAEGMTQPAIQEVAGVSKGSIHRALSVSPNGETEQPATVTGKDGKTYPARKPRKKKAAPEVEPSMFEAVGAITFKEKRRRERNDRKREERIALAQDGAGQALPGSVEIVTADFREYLLSVPDDSVGLIFTDPPYDRESIPLYGDLAEHAARILKPGGSLIAYAGHYALPEIFELMTPHLRYWWVCATQHTGGNARLTGKNIYVGWKPLVWFVKQKRGSDEFISDFVRSEFEGKDLHDWQQGGTEAEYYIQHLTEPGETVLDPFAGSGTTLLAALALGRKAIGVEIDAERANVARGRLSSWSD